jgi:hypothetical protein
MMNVISRRLAALASTVLLVIGGLALAAPADASVVAGGDITNAGSGLCLGIQGSSTSSGASAEQGYCSGTPTQTWSIRAQVRDSRGYVATQFENGAHLCLGVHGGSTSSGAQVVQGTCSGRSDHSQFWFVFANGDGTYRVVNYKSSLCMGIQGSSVASGAKVLQGFCSTPPTLTQRWF